MNKNFIILVLVAVIVILFSFKGCNTKTNTNNIDVNDTTLIHIDTTYVIDTFKVNVDSLVIRYSTRFKDSTIYNIIDSLRLDSASITEEYFCKNYYDDTLKIDSLLTIRIQENTFMNRMENRSVFAIRNTPVIKEVYEVTKPFKPKLFVGAEISGSDAFLDVGPALWYIPNKCWLIGGSYGVRQKTINIHAGYRIK